MKLLAVAGLDASGKELSAFVSPCFVKETSTLATIQGATNAVQVESSRLGTSTLIGQGAGRFPTANSCVSDIIAIARGTIAPQVRSSALAAPAGDDDASRALSPLLPSRRPRTRSKRRVEIKRATRIRRPIRIKSLRIACQPRVLIPRSAPPPALLLVRSDRWVRCVDDDRGCGGGARSCRTRTNGR